MEKTIDESGLQKIFEVIATDKGRAPYYCTCDTAASTAAKVVTPQLETGSVFTLKKGTIIVVSFTNTNTASSPTFNVASGGAVGVKFNGTVISSSDKEYGGESGCLMTYIYDGTNWCFVAKSKVPSIMGASGSNHSAGLVPDTPSTAGTTKFLREDGTWVDPPTGIDNTYYCTCSTPAATAEKVITPLLESGRTFTLKYGTIIGVSFGFTNTNGSPTFNVANTGAKSVYYGTSLINTGLTTPTEYLKCAGDEDGILFYQLWENGWTFIGKAGTRYSDVFYDIRTIAYNNATSGTVTIDGRYPITVLTVTGNISSLSIGNTADMPANHSAHVILTASSAYTVAIAHNATTSVCPDGADPDPLEIPAGGYVEVDFLKVNSKIYVRGV